MKLLIVDDSGAVAQEYGAVTAQADGISIECETLKVCIPGEVDDTIADEYTRYGEPLPGTPDESKDGT